MARSKQKTVYKNFEMHYYWFTINDTVADATASFDYQVSVGTKPGHNPDLFVTLMDGRWPTLNDYDLRSTVQGADSVRIASDMPIWTEHGWNTSSGVVVVVGVKVANSATPYDLILTSNATMPREIERINIDQSLTVTTEGAGDKVFQLYNWEHKDVLLTVNMESGSGTLMYQRTGQNDFT